ncbi:hypothetical protein [Alienimonas chondri]|uniref:ParB/Sulfiredoxin domain-containing protein n=1 Tax=Alienimonas chondri TaxID=2681879 RepID=A0ABX1VIU6_9PLAN|nr:hypothetical protein [Alienimonas chondri]NNJ27828.1 hypothetical protein [Alienimonas chondri]
MAGVNENDSLLAAEYEPNERFQMRAGGTDQTTAEEYADVLREAQKFGGPWPFPKLEGVRDTGSVLHLYGGFTRLAAAKLADWSDPVPVRSLRGDDDLALKMALKENADHGVRRTNADKRKAVETALLVPWWSGKSDREIAGMCAVSHEFVRKVRGELEDVGTVSTVDTVVGRDGVEQPRRKSKAKPAPKEKKPRPVASRPQTPRSVERHVVEDPTEEPTTTLPWRFGLSDLESVLVALDADERSEAKRRLLEIANRL